MQIFDKKPPGTAECTRNGFGTKPESDRNKTAAPRQFTILIVDDNESMLELTKMNVSRLGHTIKTAESGERALEIFRQGGIDLILSDFDMPGMDGGALLIEAKRIDPGVRFICQTGDFNDEKIKMLMDAGALRVLLKPAERRAYKHAISSALEKTPAAKKEHATLLVVDDDEDFRGIITQTLVDLGYSIKTASNGKEGLDIIRGCDIDLVLSDYNMPAMDGLEMLREITGEKPGLKVVIMTGFSSRTPLADEMLMLQAGAEAVLRKPFNVDQLKETIAKLI
jgi:CheY-like chemotaxis protein